MKTAKLLCVNALKHQYKTGFKLGEINLQLDCGDVLAVLGANGAGKSSLLNLLSQGQRPHAGQQYFMGHSSNADDQQRRRLTGYLSDPLILYPDMTVNEFLHYSVALYGIKKTQKNRCIKQAITDCQLTTIQNQVIKTLSKGMQRRVALAQAIAHQPKLILLDEPSDGLDYEQQKNMRLLINKLRQNAAIVISTHNYQDVSTCATQILVLKNGEVILQGDIALFHNYCQTNSLIARFINPPTTEHIMKIKAVNQVEQCDHQCFLISGENSDQLTTELIQTAIQSGWQLAEIHQQQQNLDSLFQQLNSQQRQ